MARPELSRAQSTAILLAHYHEIKTVFSILPKLRTIKDDEKIRARILEDLAYFIKKGLKHDIDDHEIFKLFSPESQTTLIGGTE